MTMPLPPAAAPGDRLLHRRGGVLEDREAGQCRGDGTPTGTLAAKDRVKVDARKGQVSFSKA